MDATRIRETAEREGDEAEATDDATEAFPVPELRDDAGAEPEPEPEPEPVAARGPSSEADMEKALKALDREATRHAGSVEKIMGEGFADVLPCPTCQIPGYVFPFQDASPDDQLRRLATLSYFGEGEVNYREATDKAACPTCDGYGIVLSGSRNPTHREVACGACSGMGWIQTGAGVAPVPGLPTAPTATGANGSGFTPDSGPDAWGRPPGSRFYGAVPGFEQ